MVEDLHRLLAALKVPPPYILVGHSMGGLLVRLYARTYGSEVAGVVLADADEPAIVADAVRRVVDACKTKGRVK